MDNVQLIEGKNYAPENLGVVCVLGLGKTGESVARYLCDLIGKRVDSVHVYAGEKKEFAMRCADKLLKNGATVSFDDKEIKHKFDLCITSPGIPEVSDLIRSARENCAEVISEIEFAWRECSSSSKWIAITGTNGKTTTTSLTTHILNSAGKHALAVGNIGNVALDAVAADQRKGMYEHTDIYVAEMSSYQLALCDKFSCEVSALINITPDHISWHGSFEEYVMAKLKVFNHCDTGIVNIDDAEIKKNFEEIQSRNNKAVIQINHDEDNIKVKLQGEVHNIMPIAEMKIIGEHNCVNARIASAICLVLGLNDQQIAEGILSFNALEHRLEPCGIVAGIRLFNDSKATNVDSVLVAIDAFPPKKAIFMMGGKDKNTSLDELVKKSVDNLKGVICYGEAKDRFFDAFSKIQKNESFILEKSDNMKTAFKIALENAYPGDFVVLSPACSSFDEFNNFEERGEKFKELVEKCK